MPGHFFTQMKIERSFNVGPSVLGAFAVGFACASMAFTVGLVGLLVPWMELWGELYLFAHWMVVYMVPR